MKINICSTPVSLAAFVVANVCYIIISLFAHSETMIVSIEHSKTHNVRLQHLQDCLYYRTCIQEEGNCSRVCILMRNGFILWVW